MSGGLAFNPNSWNLTAISILMTGYQIAKSAERISECIGKAIEAINADIKHS